MFYYLAQVKSKENRNLGLISPGWLVGWFIGLLMVSLLTNLFFFRLTEEFHSSQKVYVIMIWFKNMVLSYYNTEN